MMLTMSDKADVQVGFRIPSSMVESLMRFKPPLVPNTAIYVAALNFYIEAAERFGVDVLLRPNVGFVKAKGRPPGENHNAKQ